VNVLPFITHGDEDGVPLVVLGRARRVYFFNRRPNLPRGMTMRELAAEHADALKHLSPVDVAGLSTGGSIAQQLAADHPHRVDRLILISTACRLGPVAKRMQRQAAARVRKGANGKALAVLARGLAPDDFAGIAAGAAARLAGPRLFKDLGDMATTIEAEDAFDLADLAPIQSRTLIVGGGRDPFYPRALFEETKRLIPRSELLVFERRGRTSVFNDARFAPALEAFLDG
jgi:pimeloyl-ACP methyl ester carboxylesterase